MVWSSGKFPFDLPGYGFITFVNKANASSATTQYDMGPFSSSISIASGKSIVLLIICLPQIQFLKTPSSLHLPGAPM